MPHPLEGIRILELGQIIAGTYGSQVLSDMGAEVIKVEAPEGDLGRNPSVAPYRGVSGLFLTLNRNKQSIVINLKTEAGRSVFYDLAKVSDVVIDNFRPGVLERLHIDYATLSRINPRIIQCSVTGFGNEGAYKDYPALDIIIQASSRGRPAPRMTTRCRGRRSQRRMVTSSSRRGRKCSGRSCVQYSNSRNWLTTRDLQPMRCAWKTERL